MNTSNQTTNTSKSGKWFWVDAIWVISGAAAVAAAIVVSQLPAVRAWWFQQTAPNCLGQFTPDELRVRLIKNYLKFQLNGTHGDPKRLRLYELALVPRTFDVESIKSGLRDGSLMNSVMAERKVLSSAEAIDALDAAALGSNVTVASYSTLRRSLELIPLASIRAASAADIQLRRNTSFQLSIEEQARGFGAAYFWIDQFWYLSLACCDGRGDESGLSPSWHVDNNIKTLNTRSTSFLVVNSCGDLLTREYDNDVFYSF